MILQSFEVIVVACCYLSCPALYSLKQMGVGE